MEEERERKRLDVDPKYPPRDTQWCLKRVDVWNTRSMMSSRITPCLTPTLRVWSHAFPEIIALASRLDTTFELKLYI